MPKNPPATAVTTETASTIASTVRPLRVGIHGSSRQAERIVAAAGHAEERISYVPYDVREPFRLLRAGELDVMLVKFELREPDIVTSGPVAFDSRAVLVRADHPLAGRASVSVEDITAYDAFRCPGDFPPYIWDLVVPPMTPLGGRMRRVLEMGSLAELAETLAGSDSVHLSFRSLDGIVPSGIKVVPVTDLPAAPVSLARLRDTPPSPELAAFIAAAERSAAR
ncbi:LysR substrate-binding domain-containing protein [Streptomyces sp. NPDC059479]|uniref:LysR substrate-binding domain-containing protein n=1 Tax=Streptomyces sp. NPDC059479 TaxID=3346848 RepID=UPI00368A25E8